jgi:hypothetical protein
VTGLGKPGIDGQSAWDKTEQAIFTSFFIGASTAVAALPSLASSLPSRRNTCRSSTNRELI